MARSPHSFRLQQRLAQADAFAARRVVRLELSRAVVAGVVKPCAPPRGFAYWR